MNVRLDNRTGRHANNVSSHVPAEQNISRTTKYNLQRSEFHSNRKICNGGN